MEGSFFFFEVLKIIVLVTNYLDNFGTNIGFIYILYVLFFYAKIEYKIHRKEVLTVNSNVKAIQDKVTDFNRFGMVLLAVSVFMFIGVLIPSEGKEMQQTSVMMIATILFLAASFFSFKKATSYKKQLNELDGEAK